MNKYEMHLMSRACEVFESLDRLDEIRVDDASLCVAEKLGEWVNEYIENVSILDFDEYIDYVENFETLVRNRCINEWISMKTKKEKLIERFCEATQTDNRFDDGFFNSPTTDENGTTSVLMGFVEKETGYKVVVEIAVGDEDINED